MIKPHGSDELNPLFVYDSDKRHALVAEAQLRERIAALQEGDPELQTHVLNTAFRIEGFATGEGYWSYTGPGERVEPLQNPVDAYTRVFGEGLDDERSLSGPAETVGSTGERVNASSMVPAEIMPAKR